jgi:hypothetical protein
VDQRLPRCHPVVDIANVRLDHKQRLTRFRSTSALPPKADITGRKWHVRFAPKADIRLFRWRATVG